ncbi:sterol carrier protein domain-containing protein [Amycolatopsis thermalba]|uniref:sterol carrier protein domain-containing protein n=1 Tax=Amycolatopsis TaxID=1813 RepID=UPI003D2361DF
MCDSFCPWNSGRYRLTADGARVTCSRTTAPAELCVRATDLGAAYLGGPSLATLAETSRVTELRAGALARTSAAFRGEHEPFHPAAS